MRNKKYTFKKIISMTLATLMSVSMFTSYIFLKQHYGANAAVINIPKGGAKLKIVNEYGDNESYNGCWTEYYIDKYSSAEQYGSGYKAFGDYSKLVAVEEKGSIRLKHI